MPSFTKTLGSIVCLLAVTASSTPIGEVAARQSSGQCPSSGSLHVQPTALYSIFPKHPDLSSKSSGVQLEAYDKASQVEQVVAFSGIPANAKSCTVGWRQGSLPERVFIAKGTSALSGLRQLSGLPKTSVTYNSVKKFDTGTKDVGGLDFTNWDSLPAQSHIAGAVDCAETLYFKVALKNVDDDAKVFLQQDGDNGFEITVSC